MVWTERKRNEFWAPSFPFKLGSSISLQWEYAWMETIFCVKENFKAHEIQFAMYHSIYIIQCCCLDFGFQYALIRNNQSKKFGVEYWTLPGSNWPWRPWMGLITVMSFAHSVGWVLHIGWGNLLKGLWFFCISFASALVHFILSRLVAFFAKLI